MLMESKDFWVVNRATGHAIRSNCAAVRLVTASIVVASIELRYSTPRIRKKLYLCTIKQINVMSKLTRDKIEYMVMIE